MELIGRKLTIVYVVGCVTIEATGIVTNGAAFGKDYAIITDPTDDPHVFNAEQVLSQQAA